MPTKTSRTKKNRSKTNTKAKARARTKVKAKIKKTLLIGEQLEVERVYDKKEFKRKISTIISGLNEIETYFYKFYKDFEITLEKAFPSLYNKSIFLLNNDIKQKRILVEILQGIMDSKQIDVLRPYINQYFTSRGFELDLIIDPTLKDFDKIHKEATTITRKILNKYKEDIMKTYNIPDKFSEAIATNNTLDITPSNRRQMNVYQRSSLDIDYESNNNANQPLNNRKVKISEHQDKDPVYVTVNTTINTKHKTGVFHYTLARLRLAVGKQLKTSGIIVDVYIPFKDDYKLANNYKTISKSIRTIGGYKVPSLEYQVKHLKMRMDDTIQNSPANYKDSTTHFNYLMEYIIAKSLYELTMKGKYFTPTDTLKKSLPEEQSSIIDDFAKDFKNIAKASS
jgi:hypothetical protein